MEFFKKNIKNLIFCHFLAFFLIFSFVFPPLKQVWEIIDVSVFQFLNHSLEGRLYWQTIWAIGNHKFADWVEDLVFISFFAVIIKNALPEERLKKTAQFIFTVLCGAFIIFFVHKFFFRHYLPVHRMSPSLVFPSYVSVTNHVSWLVTKTRAQSCFPADHAATLIIFASFYTFFAGRKWGIYAIAYSLVRMTPRLIVGAHWLSDIIVGSGSVVLILLSWALCTPFQAWATHKIEGLLRRFKRKRLESEV